MSRYIVHYLYTIAADIPQQLKTGFVDQGYILLIKNEVDIFTVGNLQNIYMEHDLYLIS